MASKPNDDREPAAPVHLRVMRPLPTHQPRGMQHAQDTLGGAGAGYGTLPNGYGMDVNRPLFPPFHHQFVNPLRVGELGHIGGADLGTVIQGYEAAVPQQDPHGYWQVGAATGGQAQSNTQDAELQQQLQLRGAGFANAARTMGFQVGQPPAPPSQQARSGGFAGAGPFGEVLGQQHAPFSSTQRKVVRGRRPQVHLPPQQPNGAEGAEGTPLPGKGAAKGHQQQPPQGRQVIGTTGKPSQRLQLTQQQHLHQPQGFAASASHTQANPLAQTHHAAVPHPPAMFTPQGTFLWSWDRTMYIFAEGTMTGISPKIICEGFLQGFHGAWVEPDPEEIARRGRPSGVCPVMTFFPDGVGVEEARAWMFGGRYPCYPQPKEKMEWDRKMRTEGVEGRGDGMSALIGVPGATVVETKWDGRGVLKPVVPKKARNGRPQELDHLKNKINTRADFTRPENLNTNPNTATHKNNTHRPPSPFTNPVSRDQPANHVKNRYEYFVDPSKVLVQAFPANTPDALDTKFDYQPSQPLTPAIDGEDFVLSEYCTWPSSALVVTVKATGEVLLLTLSFDGILMAEDQRLREDVEVRKKKKKA